MTQGEPGKPLPWWVGVIAAVLAVASVMIVHAVAVGGTPLSPFTSPSSWWWWSGSNATDDAATNLRPLAAHAQPAGVLAGLRAGTTSVTRSSATHIFAVDGQDFFRFQYPLPHDAAPANSTDASATRRPSDFPVIVQKAAAEVVSTLNEHAEHWGRGSTERAAPVPVPGAPDARAGAANYLSSEYPADARPFARFTVRAITSYAIEPVENPQVRVAPRGMRLGPGGGTLVAYQVTLALELAATAARGGLPQTTPADAIVQCSWDSVCNVQGLFLRASVPVPLTQNRRTLRVLNANSWNYNHWPQRQPLIERELLRWAPDVVLLQELRVRHTGGDRAPQAAQLAAAFARTSRGPVHWYYTATVQFGEHGYDLSEEGVGIMSRFPVLRHGFLPLSSQGSFNADGLPRRVVWLTLLTPQGEVTVSTVHLTLTAQARARHYKEIGAWVKRMRGGGPGAADGGPNTTATEAEQQDAAGGYDDLTGPPVLLGGDFNEELHTLSPHPFLSRAFRDTATDALDAGAVGAPPESPLTFPAWEPVKRIDHIFAHGARARGVFAAVTGGADGVPPQWRHAQDHYPSDHLFNVADVDVEPVEDEK